MSFRSVLTHTTLALFVANQSVAALGQGPRQLADKPLGIMYAKDINERSMVNYVAGISERMGVGKTLSERIGEQFEKIVTTKAQTPVIGQLFYLVKGLVPSMETISFQSVIDESEARKLIESRKEMMGGEATLEEGLNGHYKLVRTWEHESELKPEQEVKEYSTEQAGRSNKLEIIERDGKRLQKRTGSYTQQYRYHDQFLYSNQAEDFTTVQLPSSQDIFDNLDDDNDVGVKFFADRVPQGLRSLGWTMLSAGMGTQLQQRDGEGEESWQVRQSAGNWGLAFLKSLMFDVDYGEGEGHLASGRQPIRGRFNLRPRRNSGFIKQLDDLGSGRSRFAPLLRDAAAVSIHVCLALPAEGEELFEAAADWLEVYAGRPAVSAEMSAAVLSVARALNDVAGTGTGEFMLRLAHTETSGSVVLAGFQSKDQSPPQQMQHVATFAREFTAHIAGASVESVQRHGRPLVHVRLPELDGFPARVSDIWFAQRDGCFWIAAGGENAHEIIRIAADRCEKGGRAVRTRLATAKLDLEHWMSWPQKDPTGLAALPSWIESSEASWLVSAFSPSGRNQESIPTPLLDKVMGLRGSKQAWLTLDVSKAGFAAEAELGRPLADWFFARQMDTQEQMMEQRKKQSEEQAEALRKAKEAAATAPASVPTE